MADSSATASIDRAGLAAALIAALSWATPSLFYSIASLRLSAVAASASRLLTPLLAALLAALVIGELPAATFWPGAALVLAGLWTLLR